MINNRRFFESRKAFLTLMSIISAMLILSMANLYAAGDRSGVGTEMSGNSSEYTVPEVSQQTYGSRETETGYCYQLIAEQGRVNVYSVDSYGRKAFFCETDIPYSLLSETDKKMMMAGITVDSMEELSSILQDFES